MLCMCHLYDKETAHLSWISYFQYLINIFKKIIPRKLIKWFYVQLRKLINELTWDMFGTLTVFLIKRLFCLSLTPFDPPPFDKFNLPFALSNSLTATLCLSLKNKIRLNKICIVMVSSNFGNITIALKS